MCSGLQILKYLRITFLLLIKKKKKKRPFQELFLLLFCAGEVLLSMCPGVQQSTCGEEYPHGMTWAGVPGSAMQTMVIRQLPCAWEAICCHFRAVPHSLWTIRRAQVSRSQFFGSMCTSSIKCASDLSIYVSLKIRGIPLYILTNEMEISF